MQGAWSRTCPASQLMEWSKPQREPWIIWNGIFRESNGKTHSRLQFQSNEMAFVHHTGDETKFVIHTMENSQVYNHLSIDFISYQNKKSIDFIYLASNLWLFFFFFFFEYTYISVLSYLINQTINVGEMWFGWLILILFSAMEITLKTKTTDTHIHTKSSLREHSPQSHLAAALLQLIVNVEIWMEVQFLQRSEAILDRKRHWCEKYSIAEEKRMLEQCTYASPSVMLN